MLSTDKPDKDTDLTDDGLLLPDEPDAADIQMTDRTAPGWALGISHILSIAAFALLCALAVFTIFFDALVIKDGVRIAGPLLAAGAMVPVVGLLVLEFAHSRALAGYRHARATSARRGQAIAALVVAGGLTLLHPLAGAPIALAIGLGAVGLLALGRRKSVERFWDFDTKEAVSILSGRDRTGLHLAGAQVPEHALARTMHLSATALGTIGAYALASDLANQAVFSSTAVTAIAGLSGLCVYAVLALVRGYCSVPPDAEWTPAQVEPVAVEDEDRDFEGLIVRHLSVHETGGRPLLSDVSIEVEPGSIVGILGDSGAGKSLLMATLADPFGQSHLDIRGHVRIAGLDPWQRSREDQQPSIVHVGNTGPLLKASGSENLTCFHDGAVLERGKRILEQLVFSVEAVEEICDATDATWLPGMHQKALTLSRAFLLGPQLYLLDRPEDGLHEKQVGALVTRLKHEARLGRSIVTVSENRAVMDCCDTLIVLVNGRMIDFGPAAEIRKRLSAGWGRFVGNRSLDVEDSLENWIRSQFKRPGDEPNRRRVAHVASEMLAFSCKTRDNLRQQTLIFEFKHFEDHCLLRMQDSDAPITTAVLQSAESETENSEGRRLSPLASVMSNSLDVEAGTEFDRRTLTAKIETFDPRKKQNRQGHENSAS